MPVFIANRQWVAVLLAVFMAVALSACGGGGSTSAPQMPEPMPPTAEEMCTDAGNHWVDGACLTPQENTVNMTLASIAAAVTAEDAQAAYDAVKADVTAAQGETLQAAVDARIMAINMAARADEQKQALMDAAGMIDTSDLSTQALVDAARAAIVGLRQAIADAVDVDDTSMYQMMLDNAVEAVDMAQGGIDTATRRTNQMAELDSASTMLQTALAALSGSTPTQAQLDAANNALTALNNAITSGADLTDDEKAPYQREANNAAAPISTAQMAFEEAEDEAEKAAKVAMAKTGKELFAALAGTPTTGTTALDNIDSATTPVSLSSSGLVIDAALGAGALPGATNPASVTLKAGDPAGSLGSWTGTNYAHTNAESKVMNAAVVYNNKGPGKTVSYADAGNVLADANAGTGPAYTAIKGYVTVVNGGTVDTGAALSKVMADDFLHPGIQNHSYNDVDDSAFTTRGTYDGAPGIYRCTGACSSSNDGKGSPTSLGGTWHFKPDAGESAMAHQPDANYLYYGWWVSKDKDGMPTAASVFRGVVGTVAGDGTTALTTDPAAATFEGSATYTGHAAGKFALDYSKNKVLDGTSDGGHFTADAELTAKFGNGATAGVTGTLNNFMANGESVPWSVSLHRAPWGTTGAFATPTTDDTNTAANETMGTTWSIDGTSAPRSGTWSGQMYDEMLGDPPAGDGSDVPTTATGTFYSEYDSVGRMVGAFGADKQ